MLNANFFKTASKDSGTSFKIIQSVITKWFRVLRYVGIAGLLSVLIYTGIKIMTSSVAQDKAKYKQRIVDWFVAVIIMFLLPYIMTFTFTITDKLVDLFNNDDSKDNTVTIYVYDGAAENGAWYATWFSKFTDGIGKLGKVGEFISWILDGVADTANDATFKWHGSKYSYTKFTTNLMGFVRFQTQSKSTGKKVAYEILYVMLIIFTIRFTIIYLKRMLYLAFLTMISPIVALMYPIDKMGDR